MAQSALLHALLDHFFLVDERQGHVETDPVDAQEQQGNADLQAQFRDFENGDELVHNERSGAYFLRPLSSPNSSLGTKWGRLAMPLCKAAAKNFCPGVIPEVGEVSFCFV